MKEVFDYTLNNFIWIHFNFQWTQKKKKKSIRSLNLISMTMQGMSWFWKLFHNKISFTGRIFYPFVGILSDNLHIFPQAIFEVRINHLDFNLSPHPTSGVGILKGLTLATSCVLCQDVMPFWRNQISDNLQKPHDA